MSPGEIYHVPKEPAIKIWFGDKGGQIAIRVQGDLSIVDFLAASFELYRKALKLAGKKESPFGLEDVEGS